MKRIFTSILILLFVLSTAACSNDHSQSTSNESSYVDPISDYDDISVFYPNDSDDETLPESQENESENEESADHSIETPESAFSEEPHESSEDGSVEEESSSHSEETSESASSEEPYESSDDESAEEESTDYSGETSESASSEEPHESSDNESFGDVTSEEEPHSAGGIVIKQKKYDYNGHHIIIMSVENQTKKDYTITINGSYFEANGTMIQQESKTFKGFASGYQNYFVFNPGMQFDHFEYTLTTESFGGIAFSKYLKTMDPVRITTGKTFINGTGGFFDQAHVAVSASFQVANTYDKELFYSAEFVVFDNKGGIYYIDSTLQESSAVPVESGRSPTEYRIGRYIIYTDVLWEDKSSFVLPDELQGDVIGIVCVKSISN